MSQSEGGGSKEGDRERDINSKTSDGSVPYKVYREDESIWDFRSGKTGQVPGLNVIISSGFTGNQVTW